MRRIYKRIFDITYFLSLTGFYIGIIRKAPPYAPGAALLFLAVILDEALTWTAGRRKPTDQAAETAAGGQKAATAGRQKTPAPAGGQKTPGVTGLSLIAVLPAAAVLFLILRPAMFRDISQYWQLVPAALYIIYVIVRKRSEVTYEIFLSQFRFALRTFLIFLPGLMFAKSAPEALAGIMPYLVTFLGTAVCLLRFLREDHSGTKTRTALRQGIVLAVFILLCFLMTEGNALYYMGVVLRFLYNYLIRYLILAGAYVILYVVYFVSIAVYYIAKWLGLLSVEMPERPYETGPQLPSEIMEYGTPGEAAANPVLQAIAIAIGVLAVGTAVFLILRHLLGERAREAVPEPAETEVSERVEGGRKRHLPQIFRPSDPKMAVRFYFAKLMRESRKRGIPPAKADTSREIADRASDIFESEDTKKLQALYITARYSREEGDPEAVKESAQLWKNIKAAGR